MAQFYPHYELTGHLGKIRAVIGDRLEEKTDENGQTAYAPELLSATDYFPFGMQMPGRVVVNGEGYRYGFNGKELDQEGIGGGGSTYDYGFRIYNAWSGKFLSVDPLTKSYPWYTPYQFAGNMPIWAIDLDGLEESVYTERFLKAMGRALLVLENNERLKRLYNSVNRADKFAEIKVIYTVGEYGNSGGFFEADLKRVARFVKHYRVNSREKLSESELELFSMYDKIFTENRIDIDKDILSEGDRTVMLVNINHKKSMPISNLLHEMRAHLKRAVEGRTADAITEHEDYYDIKTYPELKRYIHGEFSPPWERVKNHDSDAGKDIRAVEEAINTINKNSDEQ
jgi:RHS repeat-associated protein